MLSPSTIPLPPTLLPTMSLLKFASTTPFAVPTELPSWLAGKLRFLDGATLGSLFVIPRDVGPVEVAVNRLDNQALVRYYENAWHRWQ
jgi:predicted membrane-bound spermidine synthase